MNHIRRAVIFDLYGTLVDLKVNEATPLFWSALASGFFPPERQVSGEALRGAFTRLVQRASAAAAEGFLLDLVFSGLLEEFGLPATPDRLRRFGQEFRKHSITHLRKKSYTDDLLEAIRNSGCKLGLVSNTEALLTAYDLQALSLAVQFDAIVLSSSAGVKKPDKKIFELALAQLGLGPEECVFVGDSFEDDVAGALNAGIDPLFLAAPITTPREGEDEQRVNRAGFDLQEILGALRRLGFALPPLAPFAPRLSESR